MSKVHELLEQHGIDMHEIGNVDLDDPIGKGEEFFVSRSLSYAPTLMFELGKFYGCQVVLRRGQKKNRFTAYGRTSSLITFNLMAPFILKQITSVARQFHKDGFVPTYGKALTAVANALSVRLVRLNREAEKKEETRVQSGKNALVPVDAIQSFIEDDVPNLKSSKSRTINYRQSAMDAAKGISVNHQLKEKQLRIT